MRREIEQRLGVIKDLPIWAAGCAANMLWLQIGERRVVPAWGGGTKEVGSYALHIDCPWSWSLSGKQIASHAGRLDDLNARLGLPAVCVALHAQDNGSFQIELDNKAIFAVRVESDTDQEASEFWRLFEPSSNAEHFVVGAGGIVR
jgi:hypothetical protein